jgi:predicted phosphodiesterase
LGLRYAVISDIHANLEAFEAVLNKIEELDVDKIVCLGDLVGYNANPNECVDILRKMKIPTICGNHDAMACEIEEPWGLSPAAYRAVEWTRNALRPDNHQFLRSLPDVQKFDSFLAVHGSPSSRNAYLFTWEDVLPHFSALEEQKCAICFFGHTHSPGIFSKDGVYSAENGSGFKLREGIPYFINVGSVGQPRDGDPRTTFGVMDLTTRVYEQVRVDYPDD